MAEAKVYIDGEIVSSKEGRRPDEPLVMLSDVRSQIEWQQSFESIRVIIKSVGGSVSEGLAIIDYLKSFNVPIHTRGIGLVASIATSLFSIGTTRELTKHCKFNIHFPFGGCRGTADEMQAYVNATKQVENEMVALYESLGLSIEREELLAILRNDTELSAEQALAYGFATAVTEEVMAKKAYDLPALKTNLNFNKTPMTAEEKTEVKSLFAELADTFKKVLSGERKEVKALLELTDEATGQKVNIDTEGSNAVADAKVTWAESGDALPDGDYKLSNGQTITVAGGVITAVAEAQTDSEEVTALKEKLAAIEAENAELKASKEGAEQTAKANEEKVNTLTEEVKAMKATTEKLAKLMGSNGGVVRDENKATEENKEEVTSSATAALENYRKKREERKNKNNK